MVKLDVSLLRYLSPEDFKVLISVEMGMRNHELVPGALVNSIATLRFGGCGKILVDLTKHKLLGYERGKRYDGYRLTYAGYDYLALNVLTHRDVIGGVGNQIGVGKESDVFICESPDREHQYAIKFHRLGRVCFRKVSEKRDFYTKSRNKTSWIYLSRLAAQREFEFLRYMYHKGMPVPKPIDSNRHVVVMELIDGRILNHYTLESFEAETRDKHVASLYKRLMDLIFKFANEMRVVHGDFNEFNIIIRDNQETGELHPVIIDLPQMIGVEHELAPEQFDRDINCIAEFFSKRFHYESDYLPKWEDIREHAEVEDKMASFLKDALKTIEDDDEPEDAMLNNDDDGDNTSNHSHKSETQTSKPIPRDEASNVREDLKKLRLKQAQGSDDEADDVGRKPSETDHKLVDDIDDCVSTFSVMTVDPQEARRKLRAEIIRKENNKKKRDAAKPKNIKGDANPVRRRRKVNQSVACEDANNYQDFCF